jgi:hypothetical protein
MPHHATCIGPSLLMWVVQHAACSCHVPRTFAAHVCAPARRVLMRVVRPATCSCHMPRTFNAQAVHSHAVCTCRVYRILTAHACAPPRRVPSPRASIVSSALMWVIQPAVCSYHVPHALLAHACDPTRRALTSRASCLRRSRVRSIMPCAHALLAHATVHRAVCPRHVRRLFTAHVCSRVLTPCASYPRRSCICMRSVMRCAHATLRTFTAQTCVSTCRMPCAHATSFRHPQRPWVWCSLPCTHATRLVPSSLVRVVQHCRVLLPRAAPLHRSRVWSDMPWAHAVCIISDHTCAPPCRGL